MSGAKSFNIRFRRVIENCRHSSGYSVHLKIVISRTGEDNYLNLDKHYDADVIINTTPVGMYPNNGAGFILPKTGSLKLWIKQPSRISSRAIQKAESLCRPNIQSAKTPFLLHAEELGIKL